MNSLAKRARHIKERSKRKQIANYLQFLQIKTEIWAARSIQNMDLTAYHSMTTEERKMFRVTRLNSIAMYSTSSTADLLKSSKRIFYNVNFFFEVMFVLFIR